MRPYVTCHDHPWPFMAQPGPLSSREQVLGSVMRLGVKMHLYWEDPQKEDGAYFHELLEGVQIHIYIYIYIYT